MKNYFKIGVILLVLALLVTYVLDMARTLRKSGKISAAAMNYDLPSDKNLTQEDSALFRSSSWERLSPIVIWRHKKREPVLFLNYDAKYVIVVNKVRVDQAFSMSKSFRWVNSIVETTKFISYRSTDEGNFFTLFAFGDLNPRPEKIILTLDSDSLTNTILNDSVLAFNLKCRKLSIRYDSIPVDIFLEKPKSWIDSNPYLPMNLCFIKKQPYVYLIFMFTSELDHRMKDGVLDSLINFDF